MPHHDNKVEDMAKQVQVIRATKNLDEADIIRVAAYCRVSTDSKDQINSFLAQVQYYNDYIRGNDKMRLVDIYADEGITGTEMKKRDEFLRMIKDAKTGKIDRVLVKSVLRFARNSLDCIETIRTLKENGVSVYFENDNLDTDKMNSEMMLYIKSAFSQSESLNHSRRMATSVRMRMENGTYLGGSVPYGYRLYEGKIEIVPEEAERVRTVFKMYLSGIGRYAIAKYMRETESSDMIWSIGRITYMLENERYKGDYLMHKFFTPNQLPLRRRRNKGEEEKYYWENAHEPIISKEDFENVQKIKREKSSRFSGESETKAFFSQKIRCRKCGWSFHKLKGSDQECWVCSRKGLSVEICRSPKLSRGDLESAFVRMFNSLQENKKKVVDDTISLLQSLKVKCNMGNSDIAEIDAELATLATQNKAYADMFSMGILDQVTYLEKADRTKRKIAELRSRRLKVLNADEEERCIEGLRELKRKLELLPNSISKFEEVLFTEIVDVMFVEQDGAIVFKVKGDLELKVRRY